jgi:DNA-binding response OmpR family regulator
LRSDKERDKAGGEGVKAKVLIIEDEREVAELIGLYLKQEGISYEICGSAEEGLEVFDAEDIDLVVLDINLPGMDGFEFLDTIRKKSDIPVIIVSARKADEDLILALGIGADEYVEKPFSPKVLVARLRAVLRRYSSSEKQEGRSVRFGAFKIDMDSRILTKDGVPISLPPKEFEVLLFLLRNAGSVKTNQEIYQEVWGGGYGDLATVPVHIQRLRRKIEENPEKPAFIINLYGSGYMIRKESLLYDPQEGHT